MSAWGTAAPWPAELLTVTPEFPRETHPLAVERVPSQIPGLTGGASWPSR
jgi:hypothetical protein